MDNPTEAADYLRTRSFPLFVGVEQRSDRSRVGGVREMTFRDIHIHSDNAVLLQALTDSTGRSGTVA